MEKRLRIRLWTLFTALFILFTVVVGFSFRELALGGAKKKALDISELVRDTLTSYMVMGVINRRDEFLTRIREMPGVEKIKVIRGEAVIRQFGPGKISEMPEDEMERQVLSKGVVLEKLDESLEKVTYKVVIPYKAQLVKGINCLSCHNAKEGEVLGAISLTMDLTQIWRNTAGILVLLTFLFGLAIFIATKVLRASFKPHLKLVKEISECMDYALKGDFSHRVNTEAGEEEKMLVDKLNQTLEYLDRGLKSIEEKVRAMIGYGVLKTGDTISDTSKIVDELLRIYKFKRIIEKDKSKQDVYRRLIDVFENYMSLDKFSFYEVDKDKMKPIYIKGMDSWCSEVIFENADECRAKRTGGFVDSREFYCVCPNFVDNEACMSGSLMYSCIPVYVGGRVGNVFQVVYEPEMEEFIQLLIPYLIGYLNEASPVLEARTYMDMLREQSIVDPLTGFYNRRFLEEIANNLTAQIKRRGTALGILAIDIDFFKQVNDTYGHDVGDEVLKELAKAIKESIRKSDIPIRFGGEEFLVLLVDVQPGYSVQVAEKIRKAIENKVINAGVVNLKKTVSIGVSEYPLDSEKLWQCIKFADVALYRAKEEGRNSVVRFSPDMWTRAEY